MSKKITLLIDTIITPYEVARYNAINHVLRGKLRVWFLAKTDINRAWQSFPETTFLHEFLPDLPLRLMGKDLHTLHINSGVWAKLTAIKSHLERVIICGWDSPTYWLTVAFCQKNHIPYVLWSGSTQCEQSWRRTLSMPLIKWIVAGAESYIAYGTRAREFLQELGAKEHLIRIFFNSVDIDYFKNQAKEMRPQQVALRKKLKIPANSYVFLYVGQLIERKGILELLEAFSVVQQSTKKVSLVLVGTGSLEDQVKALGKKDAVYHIPHTQFFELPQVYALADCLVLPSQEEVWGLVVNEALASNLPVITSDRVGASTDLVIHAQTGYTYPSGNIPELVKKMKLCVKSSKKMQPYLWQAVAKTDPLVMAKKVFGAYT